MGTGTHLIIVIKAETGRIHRAAFELVARPYVR